MANKSLMTKTMPLSQAMHDAPNSAGCYQIYKGDELVYVGKAGDGIRKRFVQYYNGTTAHYPSAQMIYESRDSLSVKWKVIEDSSQVASQEAKWIRSYKPIWNKQSGHGDKGVLANVASSKCSTITKSCNSSSSKTLKIVSEPTIVEKVKVSKVAGNMAKGAALSGGITAGIEIGKGIINGESLGTCTEHTVSKSLEAATSGAGGVLGAEIGSAFGPVGTIAGYLAGTLITDEVVEGVFDETGFQAGIIAEDIKDKVSDAAFETSMAIGSIGDALKYNPVTEGLGALGESIADGISSTIFDIRLGLGWF